MQVDETTLQRYFSAAYEELRRLASSVRERDPSETLNPTALVNEAYLKLAKDLPAAFDSKLHFKRIAARAMRQVLVEAARRRRSLKRGGDLAFVTFNEALDAAPERSADVLALDAALQALAHLDARQAEVVECLFFGGLTLDETAAVLGVSKATISRDWKAARAWLKLEMRQR